MGAILLYDTICKMSTGRKHPADILLWKKEKYEKKESFPLMKNPLNEKKPNGLALIPFVIFIAIYMGAGVYYQVKGKEMAFYQFPSVTAMFLAVLAAFIMFKGTINEKFDVFAKGAANVDILTMLMIYILAGAFASVAANMGGRESTVNLGLSLVPVQFLAAGLFVISAFMGTATGSSMGTVSAVIPIAVGIAEKGGLSLTVVIGAVVGGAMFGDNLSMISDTTIAATRSQRCEMRDKFRVNFLVALPAAVVTLILLLFIGRPEVVMPLEALPFDIIKVLPYVLVLVLALCGLNVFFALTIGIFSAGIIGICAGDMTIAGFAQSVWTGFTSMNEVFFLTLLCGGMSELIAKNGGIAWIIQKLRTVMKGNKSAQVGIAAMVSLCDCATANNTVAPPHRLAAGYFLLRVSGHYPLWRPAAQRRGADQRHRHLGGAVHQPRRHRGRHVVLLAAGGLRPAVHLRALCRRRVPQGSLELGVWLRPVRRGGKKGLAGTGAGGRGALIKVVQNCRGEPRQFSHSKSFPRRRLFTRYVLQNADKYGKLGKKIPHWDDIRR